jgi:predicted nucleic acid-binding protein
VTLVDTSVWIDHWRHGNARLASTLEGGLVTAHPFVIGELACVNIPRRASTLRLLDALPKIPAARDREVMTLIEAAGLSGLGLGWVDAHLLAASRMNAMSLWTLDRALRRAAERLGIFEEPEA